MSKSPLADGQSAVNGVPVYYEVHGSGAPTILIHGAFGTIESCFAHLLPRLAASRQIIAVELQGHGHTPDITRPLTYEAMADDLAALARQLGHDRADFVECLLAPRKSVCSNTSNYSTKHDPRSRLPSKPETVRQATHRTKPPNVAWINDPSKQALIKHA